MTASPTLSSSTPSGSSNFLSCKTSIFTPRAWTTKIHSFRCCLQSPKIWNLNKSEQRHFFRFPTDSNGEESLTYLSYQTLTVILTTSISAQTLSLFFAHINPGVKICFLGRPVRATPPSDSSLLPPLLPPSLLLFPPLLSLVDCKVIVIFSSRCVLVVFSLSAHCVLIVFTLCSCCLHVVFSLCSCCPLVVLSLVDRKVIIIFSSCRVVFLFCSRCPLVG